MRAGSMAALRAEKSGPSPIVIRYCVPRIVASLGFQAHNGAHADWSARQKAALPDS